MTDFERRFSAYRDEFEWLYMELYNDREALDRLETELAGLADERCDELKQLDSVREKDKSWYKHAGMLGMTLYTDLFAGSLNGLREKLPYFKEQGITYLHLMPLLQMPHPDNDGGYAVEDFGSVDSTMGTNEDLMALTADLRKAGISLCLDFVMNHTASTHEWAMKAKARDPHYITYYHTFENRDIPNWYEETMPQVFPTTAPGNFTYNEEMQRWVMTTFYPFQWDLNYSNPEVFREMSEAMVRLCNMGVEVLRIDAVPYIWKELGTSCRNLPRVHNIVRLIRIITDCVCPAVILKGEVVMPPHELAAYFGTPEHPECHILYNVSCMVNLWSSLASENTRLLVSQLNAFLSLPAHCGFVNYLRCHDDIGWGLDEAEERRLGMDPLEHKKFLYHFFEGQFPDSYARGSLYNYDPVTQDARTCGTAASLCGLEAAGSEYQRNEAIARDLMMHAAMMSLSGFPMLNCGDEIAQLNDWTYLDDPNRREDSRNIHRARYNYEAFKLRNDPETNQGRLWLGLRQMEEIRKSLDCFEDGTWVTTWSTENDKVLAIVRRHEADELLCLANFSHDTEHCYLSCIGGDYVDAFTGTEVNMDMGCTLRPHQYMWLKKV